MRGSLFVECFDAFKIGIIPAHAGLTICLAATLDSAGDHPRACGAHMDFWERQSLREGSSPRMRGSLLVDAPLDAERGIIPAHAGLTRPCDCPQLRVWDHPRACGAHCASASCLSRCSGSSPRMRGSQAHKERSYHRPGIIPAHAGLTPSHDISSPLGRDHPRACGAHVGS